MAEPTTGPDESLFAERLYIEGWALALTFGAEEEFRAGGISIGIACAILSLLVQLVVIRWRSIRNWLGPRFARTADGFVHDFKAWVATLAFFLLVVALSPFAQHGRWPFAGEERGIDVGWLLPMDAVNRFVPSDVTRNWRLSASPEQQQVAGYLRQQLLDGNLVARGHPHTGTAADNALVEIQLAQWQYLRIVGNDFSSAVASNGPQNSYDGLEVKFLKALPPVVGAPQKLTAEGQQFRADLRSLVTDCMVDLDRNFGGVLRAMMMQDPARAEANGKVFQYFLGQALDSSMPKLSHIIEMAHTDIDAVDENKFQHEIKDYFDYYHAAQRNIYQYNLTLHLDLKKVPEVSEWLETDVRCLEKIRHLRFSPRWTNDVGLPDSYMATVGRKWETPWTSQ